MKNTLALFLAFIFAYVPAYAQTATLNLSAVTGTLPQANGGTGYFPVSAYGANGTSSDDCPAIQLAINAAEGTSAGGVVTFNSIVYNCKTGLTFDPAFVSFQWNGAVLYAAYMTSGPLFTVMNTRPPYAMNWNYKNFFEHFMFIGPGANSGVDLFVFNSPAPAGNTSSQISISYGSAFGFRTAETYENSAYLINENNVEYGMMGTCFSMPAGFNNYGENISHSHGSCFQSNLGVYSDQNLLMNTQNFDHFSFDYNTQIVDDEAGVVNFDTCHFESYGSALKGVLFKVADSTGAVIRVHGGDWFFDDVSPFSGASALIESDGAGSIDFDNMFMHNLALTSQTLATGTGQVNITNTRMHTVSDLNLQTEGIGGTNENYMSDGGFESSKITDLLWIASDTQPVLNRFTGSNMTLANDSATCGGHSGNQSLKIGKNTSAWGGVMYIAAPIPSHQTALLNFWYSKPGTQTGVVYLNYYFVQVLGSDGNGIPVIGKQSASLGGITLNLTSQPIPWSQFAAVPSPAHIMPPWATHIAVQVNANGMQAGALCIDDMVVNSM